METSGNFKSAIEFRYGKRTANARHVMDLLLLGLPEDASKIEGAPANAFDLLAGTTISARIAGPDARSAMAAIEKLFRRSFDGPAEIG